VHDPKGLLGKVRLGASASVESTNELKDWQVFSLPLDAKELAGLKFTPAPATGVPKTGRQPAFWRAHFTIAQPGDTFLDLRSWSKGVVWVNGYCLARFWNIGPTQTAYVPGPWLKSGDNEVIVLDLFGPQKATIAGLAQPILDQLRPALDFQHDRRPEVELSLDSVTPAHTGQFAPGSEMQEVKFARPVQGRFFCLESLSAQDGKPYAAVAELDLLDESGKPMSHEGWTVAYVDSEERDREDGSAENAIDGQIANFWHTQWGGASPGHPHRLVLDLGQSMKVAGLRYVPRQDSGQEGGRIKEYRVYIGDKLVRR
jgi:beta-galactosidase